MNANAPEAHPEAVAAARQFLDDYLVAFNGRNLEAVNAAMNYPGVRLPDTSLMLVEPGHYTADRMSTGSLEQWGSSQWVNVEAIQASEDKVHFAIEFTRYRPDGSEIGTFNTLYIVTRQDGHWGVKMRSSFGV